ncbi:MAG: 1,4-alpha-glucan branching protein GlgB [bacterium]
MPRKKKSAISSQHKMPEGIKRLLAVEHHDPHNILGPHPAERKGQKGVVVRAFHPEASKVELLLPNSKPRAMSEQATSGLFEIFLSGESLPLSYQLRFHLTSGEKLERHDPYQFLPTLGEMDLHLISEGRHWRLFDKLGGRLKTTDGVEGVAFAVWAPNARRVSVVGDFNRWDGRIHPMRSLGSSGVWELFIPGVRAGDLYKFEIKTHDGHLRVKSDPLAFSIQISPETASRVWDQSRYKWRDQQWIQGRTQKDPRHQPTAIYEVHLGSWRRVPEEGNRPLTYREAAPLLVSHCREYGFSHVEFLPLSEYPFEGSWGYQVTGYYAPTARFGTPDDFKFLVDTLHQNGIGVIMDWVPAHFPKDDFALRWFDGTALYEHLDPRLGEHRDWGTLIFNFGRNEVSNFLIASALFWLETYHIDGLRVDAVASMLYLDYSRDEGEWVPNKFGGRENLEAIAFLRRFNETVYSLFPGCFTVAEESTAWTGVSRPTYVGGLGFGFKWDMGWMHDTLRYFSKDPVHRSYHHNDLTFSMMYSYSENFILSLSHDEVVHGKGSFYNKMPGDPWQKFANLRLLFAYLYTHPGKKLLFMGSEFGQDWEWRHDHSLDWHLLKDDFMRQGLSHFMRDLGRIYLAHRCFWERDCEPSGFAWIDCHDAANSTLSFVRFGHDDHLVCLFNMTPLPRGRYRFGVPREGTYKEILNSDSIFYGGSNVGNEGSIATHPGPWHLFDHFIEVTLPPLGCLILAPHEKE